MSERKRPQVRNIDLVEHLDNPDCLVEVNVQVGEDAHVAVLYTDMNGEHHAAKFTADQAWIVGDVIAQFDRRGIREFGQLLVVAVHEIAAEEDE